MSPANAQGYRWGYYKCERSKTANLDLLLFSINIIKSVFPKLVLEMKGRFLNFLLFSNMH
jgi:hypothetical protein